jgi:streptogramin lyase
VCFITKWGSTGSSEGQFRIPYDITVDSKKFVYVADLFNHRIQKFDSNGTFITSWNLTGAPLGIGAVPNEDIVYVTANYNKILKFDSNGTFITSWNLNRTSEFGSTALQGLAIDSEEKVFVTNINDQRIQKFDSNGTFITSWNLNRTNSIEHPGSSGIAFDSVNNVYISNTKNNNIQKFTSTIQ